MRIGRARPDGGLLRATVRHRRDGGSAPTPKEVRSQDRIDGRRSEPWPSRTPCATQLDIPVVAAPLFLVSEPDQANGAIEVHEATSAGVPRRPAERPPVLGVSQRGYRLRDVGAGPPRPTAGLAKPPSPATHEAVTRTW